MRSKPQQTGIAKILLALKYSLSGIQFVFKNEWAFRAELLMCTFLMPVIYIIDLNKIEKLFLISSLFFVLLAELMNSAIEAVVDRISGKDHSLSKAAKDIGSSLVLLSFIYFGCVCLIILLWE